MNGTLKVSTQSLKNAATSFNSTGSQVKSLTTSMTSTVRSLSGQVWSGDAATKYVNKFNKLQDDINRMIRMINEHVSDLNDMANAYEKAESSNEAAVQTLTEDVII